MRKTLKRILFIFLFAFTLIILYFAVVIIINSLNDYRPSRGILIGDTDQVQDTIPGNKEFVILTWNIGYGGLGRKADFFYDGGSMVRPEYDDYSKYWDEILVVINEFDTFLDFILLQEVDLSSRRSYKVDQYEQINKSLSKHDGIFVKNYDVSFVPVPLLNPMGKVVSGLSIFSWHPMVYAEHVPFTANYSWPKSLLMPDRCFLTTTYMQASGKKLHVINTHNSAFDDGSLREKQLGVLFAYMDSLFRIGDYVIAGGDWNINPPAYENKTFRSNDISFKINFNPAIFSEYPEWQVVFDPDYPTNRDVSSPYKKGITPTTIIDFYICSPNVNVLDITTFDDMFDSSDHQMVTMRFSLN